MSEKNEQIQTFDVPCISLSTGDNCNIKAVTFADHLARVQELEREVERLKDDLEDYKGRLWCALGQPENIEFIATAKQIKSERDSLKAQFAALSFSLEGFILNAHWIPQVGHKMAEEARKLINAPKGQP